MHTPVLKDPIRNAEQYLSSEPRTDRPRAGKAVSGSGPGKTSLIDAPNRLLGGREQ